jgi:predicted TIM-barrel fold metal-dependent hydrolase
MNDISMLPLLDHHCHGVVTRDLDRPDFEALLTEGTSTGSRGGTLFDSGIGLELRRRCAPLLGLEPFADPDAYLKRRAELGWAEVSRRFLGAAGLSGLFVDTGYLPEPLTSPDELGRLAGAPTRSVIRLESIAEELAAEEIGGRELITRAAEQIAEAASTAIGAKTVAAYRCGLALPVRELPRIELNAAARAFIRRSEEARRNAAGLDGGLEGGSAGELAGGRHRLADPHLIRFLIGRAIDAGLPLQVHTGFGDGDLDLSTADPLLLTPLLRELAPTGVPILLLHTYPFQRHAGYLAQVFENVFCDVGLAIPHTGHRSHQVLAELMELAPYGKVLYSSDAFGLPELYYLGAVLFRRALGRILGELELPESETGRIARLIGRENAERVYRR